MPYDDKIKLIDKVKINMYHKTETEIMQHWEGDTSTPLVSICTITYNHAPYIKEALESFLMQETSFPFEIVIDDDCSTDENAKIIQTYIDKYPHIFNANLRKKNVGISINGLGNKERARGKYIALCEGDDYWTDKNKLQLQIDILEQNQEIDMCFHKATKIDMRNQKESQMGIYLDCDGIISVKDILLKTKGQIPTASLIFKKHIVQELETFFATKSRYTVGDIFIQFFGAKRGGAYYINQAMSVYRHYASGSWSSKQQNHNTEQKIINSNSRIKAYEELNDFSNYNFTQAFHEANKKRALVIIKEPNIQYFSRISFIFKHRKYFSVNEKIAYFSLALVPIASYIPKDIYEFLKKIFKMPSAKI